MIAKLFELAQSHPAACLLAGCIVVICSLTGAVTYLYQSRESLGNRLGEKIDALNEQRVSIVLECLGKVQEIQAAEVASMEEVAKKVAELQRVLNEAAATVVATHQDVHDFTLTYKRAEQGGGGC